MNIPGAVQFKGDKRFWIIYSTKENWLKIIIYEQTESVKEAYKYFLAQFASTYDGRTARIDKVSVYAVDEIQLASIEFFYCIWPRYGDTYNEMEITHSHSAPYVLTHFRNKAATTVDNYRK